MFLIYMSNTYNTNNKQKERESKWEQESHIHHFPMNVNKFIPKKYAIENQKRRILSILSISLGVCQKQKQIDNETKNNS